MSCKKSTAAALIVCAAISFLMMSCTGTEEFSHLYENLPFEMQKIRRPLIPERSIRLDEFGAKGDGITLNTEAFRQAVEHLHSQGGGHLIVPGGIWLTGPVTLKSGIDLHISKDAVILFSPQRDLYPIVETVYEGLDTRRCISPINADGAENISITGEGTIDGNGDAWRQVKKSKMAPSQWKKLLSEGGFTNQKGDIWYPDSSSYRGAMVSDAFNVPQGMKTEEDWESVKTYLRPVMISLKNCTNVLLEGVLFQNSPNWNIHPLMCKNLIINNITVRNPWYSQNGDGIDIDSCEGVILVNSSFDVGDDAICIKSGKDEDGRRRAKPTRNVIVDNCTVFHGHGGFVVGSEMSGGVENISVSDCRFLGTDVGLRFKSCRGRGGVVRNIYIRDITMMNIPTEPLLFDLHYGGKSAVEAAAEDTEAAFDIAAMPADETTPEFRDIYIKDVICSGAARAMYFNGLPEKKISGIHVQDCTISSDKGADIRYSDGVILNNVRINQKTGPGFTFANSAKILLEKCTDAQGMTPSVKKYKSDDIEIR